MAEDGIGLTGIVVGALGCVVLGKYLSRWESKLDRHVVCNELDKYIGDLEQHCTTPEDYKELTEIRRGVEQVRSGQIPFNEGNFLSDLWNGAKGLGSKLSPKRIWSRGGKTEANGKTEPTAAAG